MNRWDESEDPAKHHVTSLGGAEESMLGQTLALDIVDLLDHPERNTAMLPEAWRSPSSSSQNENKAAAGGGKGKFLAATSAIRASHRFSALLNRVSPSGGGGRSPMSGNSPYANSLSGGGRHHQHQQKMKMMSLHQPSHDDDLSSYIASKEERKKEKEAAKQLAADVHVPVHVKQQIQQEIKSRGVFKQRKQYGYSEPISLPLHRRADALNRAENNNNNNNNYSSPQQSRVRQQQQQNQIQSQRRPQWDNTTGGGGGTASSIYLPPIQQQKRRSQSSKPTRSSSSSNAAAVGKNNNTSASAASSNKRKQQPQLQQRQERSHSASEVGKKSNNLSSQHSFASSSSSSSSAAITAASSSSFPIVASSPPRFVNDPNRPKGSIDYISALSEYKHQRQLLQQQQQQQQNDSTNISSSFSTKMGRGGRNNNNNNNSSSSTALTTAQYFSEMKAQEALALVMPLPSEAQKVVDHSSEATQSLRERIRQCKQEMEGLTLSGETLRREISEGAPIARRHTQLQQTKTKLEGDKKHREARVRDLEKMIEGMSRRLDRQLQEKEERRSADALVESRRGDLMSSSEMMRDSAALLASRRRSQAAADELSALMLGGNKGGNNNNNNNSNNNNNAAASSSSSSSSSSTAAAAAAAATGAATSSSSAACGEDNNKQNNDNKPNNNNNNNQNSPSPPPPPPPQPQQQQHHQHQHQQQQHHADNNNDQQQPPLRSSSEIYEMIKKGIVKAEHVTELSRRVEALQLRRDVLIKQRTHERRKADGVIAAAAALELTKHTVKQTKSRVDSHNASSKRNNQNNNFHGEEDDDDDDYDFGDLRKKKKKKKQVLLNSLPPSASEAKWIEEQAAALKREMQAELEKEIREMKKAHDRAVNFRRRAMDSKLSQIMDSSDSMQTKLSALNASVEQIETTSEEKLLSQAALDSQVAEKQQQLRQIFDQRVKNENDLKRMTAQTFSINQQLSKLRQELLVAEKVPVESHLEEDHKRSKIRLEKTQTISNLKNEEARITKHNSEMEKKLERLTNEHNAVEAALPTRDANVHQLQNSAGVAEMKLADTQRASENSQARLASGKLRLATAKHNQQMNEEQDQEIQKLTKTLEVKKGRLREENGRNMELLEKLDRAERLLSMTGGGSKK